ncbi:MAG: glycosyltransferase family 4 protein [Coriobacteriia bacterium]|nr:glycosyltransferase family 4 protein [Coriobacteriia bacterium]
MRIAVVHGYFLGDSGSGIYVRNLVRGLLAEGHDVTLVCQEREPEKYDFVDSVWMLDASNTVLRLAGNEHHAIGRGTCRLVRPDLGGRLLVYVDGPFAGFERGGVRAFQDAPDDWIATYIAANAAALRTAFAQWTPDLVLAQHAIMQPYTVREALAGSTPYVVTTHGSELNFSLKLDPRLVPYALDGLRDAAGVAAVSPASARDVVEWAASHGLDIAARACVMMPGIDTELFAPAPSRAEAIATLARHVELPASLDLSPGDDVLAFVGRIGWSKGIHHAIVALSLISAARPRIKLLAAGAGPARESLERLAGLLNAGNVAGARELAIADPELQTTAEYGPLIPDDIGELGEVHVAYLGHQTSENVARLFAAADLALAPSIFPEAAALVTSEALSAGALPVVANQTGLHMMAKIEADALADESFLGLLPGRNLTLALAEAIERYLDRYPTNDAAFRQRLHAIAASHFPTWQTIAREYVEMAGGENEVSRR